MVRLASKTGRAARPRGNGYLIWLVAALLALGIGGCSGSGEERPQTLLEGAMAVKAPVAEARPVIIEQLGRTRVDEYAWLRDDNWQQVVQDPAVLRADIREHLEAENAYLETVMAPLARLEDRIFEEMAGRLEPDWTSAPMPDGAYAYYARYRDGGQYPVFARRAFDPQTREMVGEEEILLDGDAEAAGHAFMNFRGVRHSPDHRYLAYGLDATGASYYTLHVRDLATGENVATLTGEATGSFAWANDSSTLFWVWRDGQSRSKRVYRQGIEDATGELVYEEPDDGYFVGVSRSSGGGFVVIYTGGHTSNELHLIDADAPQSAPVLVAERRPDLIYSLVEGGDLFYIKTNADGALDGKIMSAPRDAPGPENWTEVVAHRPGVMIETVLGFRDWLVRLETVEALPRVIVRELASGNEHLIAFDEEAYRLVVNGGYEYATDFLRFEYDSPATPLEVWDYHLASRQRTLLKRQEVPSGHDPADYRVRRLMAPAHDGETIPVTILHRRDTLLDGSAPLLLEGYGSYGSTIPARFNTNVLSLVDRGVIHAIAHVRGGMAKGYQWYLDGKLDRKKNTFHDFVSVGEALVAQGFTSRGRIVAEGASAGGLLVGAAINLAPDLFGSAIAGVAFVDVLNTMSDPTLPLTPPEWPEWGNPIVDEAAYDYISSYTPYENVQVLPPSYPHVFATTALSDTLVTYWEPAKWIARMRAARTDGGLTLLRIDMSAGHGGASGRFDSLRERAQAYTFALLTVGLADAEMGSLERGSNL